MRKISLEIFPKSTDNSALETVNDLKDKEIEFISVTSMNAKFQDTLDLCLKVQDQYKQPAIHLVCGGIDKAIIEKQLETLVSNGIKKVVVLRGDKSQYNGNSDAYSPIELVEKIANTGFFNEICVPGYPGIDVADPGYENAYKAVIAKVKAGATRIITQFTYDMTDFRYYRDTLAMRKIRVPISAGLLPIRNINNVLEVAKRCKVELPEILMQAFAEEDINQHDEIGQDVLTSLSESLLNEEFDLHYYTLNSSKHIKEAWDATTINK